MPAAHAAYARLYEPRLTPIAGVPFTLKGIITSDVERPIKLKVVGGSGGPQTIATSTATRKGTFTFRKVVLDRSGTLVAVAPRFRGNLNHAKPQVATAPVPVTVTRQSGELVALPPVVQQGTSPEAPSNAAHVVASFEPARPGRRVQLHQLTKGDWVTVQRGVQDRGGFASFEVPAGQTFRAVTLVAKRVPAVTTKNATSRSWTPEFEDTFSGDALDTRVWSDRGQDGTESQGLRTCAVVDDSMRWLSGGTLQLGIGLDPDRAAETCSYNSPRYGAGTSPYLLNSQIDSRKAYNFAHGFAAARVKWQQPRGMHGGFWLQPLAGKVPGRPDLGTEVDIVEHFGDGSLKDGFGSFVHHLAENGTMVPMAADPEPTALLKPVGDEWWSSYHVFSVEWTDREYIFRVEGREYWRETRAVSQVDQFLLFSMLTSDYELKDLQAAEMAATASVDWVRVWR